MKEILSGRKDGDVSRKVIACGVPRSGSTLVWQVLLRALPDRQVVKDHPGSWAPEEDCFIVGSIRHPYDIAASRFRGRVVGDKGDGSPETVKGTKKGLQEELRGMTHNFNVLRDLIKRYGEDIVVIRYEDFFNNFAPIFEMIENRLGATVPAPLRNSIERECSLRANRERSYALRASRDYQRTKINWGHVGVGTPGTWQMFMPRWGLPLVRKACDPLCKEWGYGS